MSKGLTRKALSLHFKEFSFEPEIKFLVSKATMSKILEDIDRGSPFIPEPIARDERVNTYYDTEGFDLYKQGFECRRRKDGAGYRYDLKAPHKLEKGPINHDRFGVFLRREYKEVTSKKSPSLHNFYKKGVDYLKPSLDKTLRGYVNGFFTRKRFTFSPTGFPKSKLEIAFENGHFETADGAKRSKTFYIIELELKSGKYNTLKKAADELQKRYGLEVAHKTKGEMGLDFSSKFMKSKLRTSFQGAKINRKKRYKDWRLDRLENR